MVGILGPAPDSRPILPHPTVWLEGASGLKGRGVDTRLREVWPGEHPSPIAPGGLTQDSGGL